MHLHGPFTQLLPLAGLPLAGALCDGQLGVIENGGVLVDGDLNGAGTVVAIGGFESLRRDYPSATVVEYASPTVCLPGLVDCHTHLCWAGSRAQDFALRNAGASYLEMAEAGGGITSTMRATRAASDEVLAAALDRRLERLRTQGITTAECKSGYGLSVDEELRHLALIRAAGERAVGIDVVATCLAAHVCPPEVAGDAAGYLAHLEAELLPVLAKAAPTRIDAFAEPSTFWGEPLERYLRAAKAYRLPRTLHADQFTPGGAVLACRLGAQSADHLEHVDGAGIAALAAAATAADPTIAVALPGASLGLGEPHAPARRLLDAGASVAIASDWNPGSAPQGQLLAQATVLAAAEKLTNAEVLAGLTYRAARALGLADRGTLAAGQRAHVSLWPTDDYRAITWHMGSLYPTLPAHG